ncbi:MAG: hypothetical protein WDO74_35050 [Pseudomonadota bacterium]
MISEQTATIALERHELISAKDFDEVLAAVHAGLGRPDFGAFNRQLSALDDWQAFKHAVAKQAGSSGLLIFLELDLGSVVARDPETPHYRIVRIIAGNHVTMESMVRTTPGAGAFAPVTLLIYERDDGVHLRYDTLTSAVYGELSAEAYRHAQDLDASVLSLLRASA